MERLIEESEKKFKFYFSAEGEKQLNIQDYAADEGKGGFSLSALTEMDAHLLRDKHFNEMYNDVNRYCSQDFIASAKHVERYYVLLAGLLRSLLRASASTFDPYERKALLEMVYRWYRDKRRTLLEQRLVKSRRQKKPLLKKILRKGERAPKRPSKEEKRKAPQTPANDSTRQVSTPSTGRRQFFDENQSRRLPLFVNRDQKKKLFITNKLKQYSRRNLMSSQHERMKAKQRLAEQAIQKAPAELSNADKKTLERQRTWAQPVQRKRPATVAADVPGKRELLSQPRLLTYNKPKSFSEMKIYKHWLRHRARDAQEKMEDMQFQDAVRTWSYNRARIEEEIQRRQESNRYSSQTGVALHKIVTLDPAEGARQAAETKKVLDKLNENIGSFLDSDSDFSDEEDVREAKEDAGEDAGEDAEDEQEETAVEQIVEDVQEDKENIPIFLSPYSKGNIQKVKNPLKTPDPPLPINEWMLEDEKNLLHRGFSRPQTVTQSSIPRTPIIGYHRQFIKPAEGEGAPASAPTSNIGTLQTEKGQDRPSTVSIFQRHARKKVNPFFLTESQHVQTSKPEIVHFHSIYDREEFQPKPAKKKKKKGKKKGAKPPPKKKGKKGKKGKEKEVAPEKPVEPEKPPTPTPPSLLRSAQLDECDRIKVSLAKSGWKVPQSVIHRSILIPEDRSFEDCVKTLPKTNFMTFQCMIPEEKKKKTGKKKGGKKKKKKKKKK